MPTAWAGVVKIITKLPTTSDIWIMPRMITLAHCSYWDGATSDSNPAAAHLFQVPAGSGSPRMTDRFSPYKIPAAKAGANGTLEEGAKRDNRVKP